MNAPLAAPEFSRMVDLRHVPAASVDYVATADECRRMAARFAIPAIDRFCATVTLATDGKVITATGRIKARIVQQCAISGEDFAVAIDAPLDLRFVPALPADATGRADEPEIEITADVCDEIEYSGLSVDLGEALAQSLALAIDPFAEGPEADRARARHNLAGDGNHGAFAGLSVLTAAGVLVAAPGNDADLPQD